MTLIAFPGKPLIDPTGDRKATMLAQLELGVGPFAAMAERDRRDIAIDDRRTRSEWARRARQKKEDRP